MTVLSQSHPNRDYSYTQSRELSWLRFNRRVLEEAGDESVPLLERLKFISIFTRNLDEFFMVRVGNLFDLSLVSPEETDNKTGLTPAGQLSEIYSVIPGLIEIKDRLYADVAALLRREGICDLAMEELTAEERKFVSACYKAKILPVLSPQIVDARHPFPHLANKALYAAGLMRSRKGTASLGFLPVPAGLPAILTMPGDPGRFIRMETVLLHYAPVLFGEYKLESSCILCVTRNADLNLDAELLEESGEDIRSRMSKLLKKRAGQSPVRLELSRKMGGEFMRLLKGRTGLENRQIYVDKAPLDMHWVFDLMKALPPEKGEPLSFPPYRPRWPEDLDRSAGVIDQIRQKDRLLFFPFDGVDPFLQLLEEAGCKVIYGVEAYKCHSKICLITLRKGDRLSYVTQIGTGNYNEDTNEQYTDLSLMTANEEIGRDGTAFFQNMLVGNLEGTYRHLLTAPAGIKARLLELIDGEIAKGPEGFICIKANAMTQREVIDKLAEASQAGVQVQLILRGICCMRPGIASRTENVHVTSIVGRYLEHSRIYRFGRGRDTRLFIASADLMTRNLDHRVEIACPVYDPEVKEMLLKILRTQLEDNVKASSLLPDGSYCRKVNTLSPCGSQEVFMAESLHRRPAAPAEKPDALHRLLGGLRGKRK